ncbi:MAG: hypothetical protein HW388_1287 [Dehalococcoidia bacterium]|nr:hypothetical protein [Dehalococcoidia bacterium]
MGRFSQSITIVAASGGYEETTEAIVDTGATFTVIPAPVLEHMGVAPQRTVRMRLADGSVVERALGTVQARLNGTEGVIYCLFGGAEEAAVIGAHTLEGFLLAVDPVGKRLVPVEGLWL